ncbi:type II secretion system F family protein [Corynebacterium lowii]|uniref:type II secretion system F family protein n=1 Tax=Corynebacterium lowii TaxID=1544413 RepID=UPI0014707176|nr:type II secretion system F family protein [Corynebacterium lowii]MDP9852182.1 tight adherence protein B [Corynebacterium lowii]
MSSLSVVIAVGIAVATGWRIVLSLRARQRNERQQQGFAAVLGRIVQQLRSGADPTVALNNAVRHGEEVDASVLQGLHDMAAGINPPESSGTIPQLGTVANLWEAARRHGVPLAPLLSQVQATLERERRHRAAVRARLMGPQSTALVLTLLPLAGMGLGTAMGAQPLSFLLGGGLGGIVLMVGTGLVSAGVLWTHLLIERAGGRR